MRNFILAITLGLIALGGWEYFNQAPKAWADVSSLPQTPIQTPVSSNLIQYISKSNVNAAINWDSFSYGGINWSSVKTFAKTFDPASGGTEHTGINWASLGT